MNLERKRDEVGQGKTSEKIQKYGLGGETCDFRFGEAFIMKNISHYRWL